MIDIVFTGIFCLIIIMGVISLIWAKKGVGAITDDLIRKLFKYIIALIASSLMFVIWVYLSTDPRVPSEAIRGLITYIFMVALFALISGAALTVKQIGDTYGFKVTEKK